MKKKVLIIRSSKQSLWGSCKVISPNLQASYGRLSDKLDLHFFDIIDDFLKREILNGQEYLQPLADQIKLLKPDEIVFIDHEPTAPKILSFLSFYIPYNQLPPLTFHIYGDFTFFGNEWKHLGTKLGGLPVKFIVASESQKKLLTYFSHDDATIDQFLFPVNSADFYFDEKERHRIRTELNVSADTKVVLYTGRVSLQKNVDLLVQEFTELYKKHNGKIKLWIAGAFDDLGAPFMGVKHHDGFMFAKMNELLLTLPDQVRSQIVFFGQIDKVRLREIQNAADCFVSLSLYHDEDYGMSPAEALSCGLPSLLSDWGGYSSFIGGGWDCELLSVKLTSFGHELRMQQLHDFISSHAVESDGAKRKARAESFQGQFSITSCEKRLYELNLKPHSRFKGFKWNLGYFSSEYWTVDIGREISKQLTPSSDNFYAEVYSNYISKN